MSTSPTPASAGAAERRLLAPPIWTHAETLALLGAYRAKLVELRRHNLRLDDWTSLAADVTRLSADSPNSSHKTPAQCRCKIDKLRKRFRSECVKPSTCWPYFELLQAIDDLLYGQNGREVSDAVFASDQKGNDQISSAVTDGQNDGQVAVTNDQKKDSQILNADTNGQNSRRFVNNVTSGQNSLRFLNSGNNGQAERRFLGSFTENQSDRGILDGFTNDKSNHPILDGVSNSQNNRRVLGTLMASGGFRFTVPKATRSKIPRVRASGWVGPRREKRKKRVRCDFFGELFSAVKGFGEIYERVEEKKMEAAKEIEKMRMEMEMKRTEMILMSQRMIINAFVNGKSGAKKAKVSTDAKVSTED